MLIGSLTDPFTVFRQDEPAGQPELEPEGSEETPDNPEGEQPDYFDEKFDPATLSPELQPAYQQMRNAFLQKTQGIAEQRRSITSPQTVAQQFASWSPEERQAFFEQAGLEYESGEEPEFEDEEEDDFFRDPRVDVLLQRDAQREELGRQEAFYNAQLDVVNEGLEALEKSTGREFSQEEIDDIGDMAMVMLDEQGMPQVEAAYQRLTRTWVPRTVKEQKREVRRQAPRPPTGRPGEQEVDLSDQDTRRAALAAEIEAAQAEDI